MAAVHVIGQEETFETVLIKEMGMAGSQLQGIPEKWKSPVARTTAATSNQGSISPKGLAGLQILSEDGFIRIPDSGKIRRFTGRTTH